MLIDAEPFSAQGGSRGALVVHGFTGSPQSMKLIAKALADAGFTVELPLLPGHGTTVGEMIPMRWADWSGAVEAAYADLAARCESVVLVGLSMGGTLATWLATRHPEIAGIALVNPLIDGTAPFWAAIADAAHQADGPTLPGVGSNIAKPGVVESAYMEIPVAPLLSLTDALGELVQDLSQVTCPVLLFTSPDDHVVDPQSSVLLAASVSGPVERVELKRSYHVATLDYDAELIVTRIVAFAQMLGGESSSPTSSASTKVSGGPGGTSA
ncbi:MAG: alpha/beta fold hydrolase [Acidimicrobiia bacterium]